MISTTRCLLATLVVLAATGSWFQRAEAEGPAAVRSMLPSPGEAIALLNATPHHGEWIDVPTGSRTLRAAVTYPDRRDGTAVVVIAAHDQKLTPWLRAIADQVTSEGFIAVVADAFAGDAADLAAVRQQMIRHPAANGISADITLSSTMDIDTAEQDARFAMSKAAWPAAMAFLNAQAKNDRGSVVEMPSHSHPAGMQAPRAPGQGSRGYPVGKLDHLPAGLSPPRTRCCART